jgi:tRNA threonylcarbamoyladenosine biosynthesis protein TsaB
MAPTGFMQSAMLVMGLDTALQRCSVAILRDGAVVGDQSVDMARGHAEHLAPMAAAALGEAGVKIADLDRIGVVVGPGGFTGVRIALSFARGLAIGVDIDVVGITSLAALAGNARDAGADELIAPIIDARRGQVYAALYEQSGLCRLQPFVSDPEQALRQLSDAAQSAKIIAIGSGASLLPPGVWRQSQGDAQINAKIVAALAAEAAPPFGRPPPLYLRGPDAKPAAPSTVPRK